MPIPVDVATNTYDWWMLASTAAGAVATTAAAGVALILANRERRERMKAEAALEALRERDRRAQARAVIVNTGIDPVMSLTSPNRGVFRLGVRNDSNGPIRDVIGVVRLRIDLETSPFYVADAVPRGEERSGTEPRQRDVQAVIGWVVQFTDAAGARWRVDSDGTVDEIP